MEGSETELYEKSKISGCVRAGAWMLAAFFGLLTVWSLTADLAGTVMAPGVIVPDGKRKTVQHVSGGTIMDIFVKEG